MRVEMLDLGWMTAPAGLWRQGDEEPERPLRLPVPAYLIETESERILIDHAGGLSLIPRSVPVVLQRAEWEAGQDRAGVERNFFQPRDYANVPPNLTLLDGDHDLLGDGSIELLNTPGHTAGHQSVQIGELVLGADVALFASGLDDHRFPAFGYSQEEAVRSAERLRALRDAGLSIQPGHDPDVLQPGPLAV
jgi:glyoxylase-like metal-dependent hydrolase (beta-lactamase superfamily II)